MFSFLKKHIDGAIYLLIGPFAIMYLFPNFFIDLGFKLHIINFTSTFSHWLGIVFMNLGALLAVVCTIIMYNTKKASPSPFSKPLRVVNIGPFKYVRHPMVWSINFVLLGQILVYGSPLLIVWFLIWLRFAHLYIERYEEPYLISVFGQDYVEYSKQTARWLPKFKK